MRLYERLLSEVGGYADQVSQGSYTAAAVDLRQAECFELSRDVLLACDHVLDTRPSTILAASDKIRVPYRLTWIEFLCANRAGAGHVKENNKTIPERFGCLLKSNNYATGFATFAWYHPSFSETVLSPIGCVFDWTFDDSNLITGENESFYSTAFARAVLVNRRKAVADKTFEMEGSIRSKFADDPAEQEAFNRLELRAATLPSEYSRWAYDADPKKLETFIDDITGEFPFLEAFLLMLNSRNALDFKRDDFVKLNVARQKKGRRALKEFATTYLRMTKVRGNRISALTKDREAAGRHNVRGHFKVRKSGVYWWNEFERGDPDRVVKRDTYRVKGEAL